MIPAIMITAIVGMLTFRGCICWYHDKSPTSPVGKISFEQFKTFYSLAPDKWYLYSGHVSYKLENKIFSRDLQFSFIDTIRYVKWKGKLDEDEALAKQSEEFKEVLESIQKDLEEYKKKYFANSATSNEDKPIDTVNSFLYVRCDNKTPVSIVSPEEYRKLLENYGYNRP